jgi:ATP-dependent DNA helicase DinG
LTDQLSTFDVLGPQGLIAKKLSRYEPRPEQLAMTSAVEKGLQERKHLVVEAGTGVGKSFAYLVPAILYVTDPNHNGPQRRIVVATHTISLQEQLIKKDIPFLNQLIPREFSTVLVKGRGNYLSKRRLRIAAERGKNLFSSSQEEDHFREIIRWAGETEDGSLSDLPFRPSRSVWDEVASDSGNCLGRSCPTHEQCFYFRARRRMENAQLLIVNHALFFSDLALRARDVQILPSYDTVIFDEAHMLPSVASEHLGLQVTSGQVEYTLQKLYSENGGRGLLSHFDLIELQPLAARCQQLAAEFFSELRQHFANDQSEAVRIRSANTASNTFAEQLYYLGETIVARAAGLSDESTRQDLSSAGNRLKALGGDIRSWLRQVSQDAVYWVEQNSGRRGNPRISMHAAPLDIGPILREHLFGEIPCVILTSATLATSNQKADDAFTFFKSQVGLTQVDTLQVGSPFNYSEQAELVLVEDMPDPTIPGSDYEKQCIRLIERYVDRYDGHAFVLFTSYSMLRSVVSRMTAWMAANNLAIYNQAEGGGRTQLLENFKENPRGVLFGTDSFWQGVDVPGEALQLVVITRIPFSVPDRPLMAARMDAMRESGGNPFYDFQIPEAIIKLRQGFGRLIRSRRDRGTVVILDPRVRTKAYGRKFLEALPACRIVTASVQG